MKPSWYPSTIIENICGQALVKLLCRNEEAEGLTPIDWLDYWAERKPKLPFMIHREGTYWRTTTWRQTQQKVRSLAAYLRSIGVSAGSHVGIFAKNSPEWIIADLAIWAVGAISVPIYPEVTQKILDAMIARSCIGHVFVGLVDTTVTFDDKIVVIPFGDKANLSALLDGQEPLDILWNWDLNAAATVTYTSGTSGQLRGAMHSFSQMTRAACGIIYERPLANSRFFSYLTLAHVVERLAIEMLCLRIGGTIYFNKTLKSLAGDLCTARPTAFVGVPRVFVQFKKAIDRKISERRLRILLSIPFVGALVKRAIRRQLGLNRARVVIVGSAPSPKGILEYFHALGLKFYEGYGMTENFGYSHRNFPGRNRLGSVGESLPGVKVKIDACGEILIDSPGNMLGYHNDLEATFAAFADGFLRTGDLGSLDEDGYLRITGRKKDVFKTSVGKQVSPAQIEAMIETHEPVDRALVIGDGLAAPIAVVRLNGTTDDRTSQDSLAERLIAIRDLVNQQIEPHERIRKIVVTDDDWINDPQFATPTQKLRRMALEKHYKPYFAAWMSARQSALVSSAPWLDAKAKTSDRVNT